MQYLVKRIVDGIRVRWEIFTIQLQLARNCFKRATAGIRRAGAIHAIRMDISVYLMEYSERSRIPIEWQRKRAGAFSRAIRDIRELDSTRGIPLLIEIMAKVGSESVRAFELENGHATCETNFRAKEIVKEATDALLAIDPRIFEKYPQYEEIRTRLDCATHKACDELQTKLDEKRAAKVAKITACTHDWVKLRDNTSLEWGESQQAIWHSNNPSSEWRCRKCGYSMTNYRSRPSQLSRSGYKEPHKLG